MPNIFNTLTSKVAAAVKAKGKDEAVNGHAPDARLPGFADWLEKQRQGDMREGEAFAAKYFGEGNPQMAEILKARHEAAFGDHSAETELRRSQGLSGINQSMTTGLRALKGMQGMSGIAGGAALGQALPTLSKATIARGNLERDLALGEMERKEKALSNYESTLTGERAGAIGTQFGFAGLGSQDRTGGMQYLLGKDFITAAQGAVNGMRPTPAGVAGSAVSQTPNIARNPLSVPIFENYFGGLKTSGLNPAKW